LGADRISPLSRALALIEEQPERLLCIVGPTATGKTDLALDVAARVNGEIISADSVQIYRGFDIGSGKPTQEEQARVPHHLIDALDPFEQVDAASFAKLADQSITDIRARGRVPILCGGTFFWVRSLVLGLVEAPAGDAEIRARHRAFVEEHGRQALHADLVKRDPETAQRLHPNDVVRVSRALEVLELSGRTMSSFQSEHGFRAHRMEHKLIGLAHDPAVLTERIARRVDRFFTDGFEAEVRRLLEAGFGEARAMGSVGYAEVRAYLAGALPESELKETIVRSTRVFARRQRTWLKHAAIEWL